MALRTSARLRLEERALLLVIGPEPGSRCYRVQTGLNFKTQRQRREYLVCAQRVLDEILEDRSAIPRGPDAWRDVAEAIRWRLEHEMLKKAEVRTRVRER